MEKEAQSRRIFQNEEGRSVVQGLKFPRSVNRCNRTEREQEVCDRGHILRIQKWGLLNDKIQNVAVDYAGHTGAEYVGLTITVVLISPKVIEILG